MQPRLCLRGGTIQRRSHLHVVYMCGGDGDSQLDCRPADWPVRRQSPDADTCVHYGKLLVGATTTERLPERRRRRDDAVPCTNAATGGQACSINKLMACMRSNRPDGRVTVNRTSAPCCRRHIERENRSPVGWFCGAPLVVVAGTKWSSRCRFVGRDEHISHRVITGQ